MSNWWQPVTTKQDPTLAPNRDLWPPWESLVTNHHLTGQTWKISDQSWKEISREKSEWTYPIQKYVFYTVKNIRWKIQPTTDTLVSLNRAWDWCPVMFHINQVLVIRHFQQIWLVTGDVLWNQSPTKQGHQSQPLPNARYQRNAESLCWWRWRIPSPYEETYIPIVQDGVFQL